MSAERTPLEQSRPGARPKRRWLSYSLRTLLVFVTLCALAAYQSGQWWRQMADEDAAIEELQEIPGVGMQHMRDPHDEDGNRASPPAWFRRLVGRRNFANTTDVCIEYSHADDPPADEGTATVVSYDDVLRLIGSLPGLVHLTVIENRTDAAPKISTAGLSYLQALGQLHNLRLSPRTLNDAELVAVSSLHLERLDCRIESSTVRDWSPLKTMTSLSRLGLCIDRRPTSGLSGLDALTSIRELLLDGDGIREEDLATIGEMKNLERLA